MLLLLLLMLIMTMMLIMRLLLLMIMIMTTTMMITMQASKQASKQRNKQHDCLEVVFSTARFQRALCALEESKRNLSPQCPAASPSSAKSLTTTDKWLLTWR